jgi:hypothetical protein
MNCPKCNEDIMSMSVHYCNIKSTMNTPTPRTKEIWGAMLYTYPFIINCVNETGEMEAELTAAREEIKAVTEQRDKLAELSGFGEFDKP